MNRALRVVFASALVLLVATQAWAQATAQINGTVTDASGGVLPGAAFNWFRPSPAGVTPVTAGNNPTSPVTNLSNVNFGRYLAADDPRIMQFAVKYQF